MLILALLMAVEKNVRWVVARARGGRRVAGVERHFAGFSLTGSGNPSPVRPAYTAGPPKELFQLKPRRCSAPTMFGSADLEEHCRGVPRTSVWRLAHYRVAANAYTEP